MRQFLNSLPDGLDVQFVQEIRSGNQAVADAHQKLSEGATNPTARALTEARLDRLSRLDHEGRAPFHGLKLFVRREAGESLLARPKLFSLPKKFNPSPRRDWSGN